MPTPYIGQICNYHPDTVERSGWPGDKPYAAMVVEAKIADGMKPRVNLHVFHPNGQRFYKVDVTFCLGDEIATFGQADAFIGD